MNENSTIESLNQFENIKVLELNEVEQNYMVKLGLEVLQKRHNPGECLQSPEDTRQYLQLLLSDRKNEVFGILLMDNKHRILAVEELFHGTLNHASVFVRPIIQRALELNSASCILFHNHPSGDPEPSNADKAITKKIVDALKHIDVSTLDHIVVGAEGSISFAERGLI